MRLEQARIARESAAIDDHAVNCGIFLLSELRELKCEILLNIHVIASWNELDKLQWKYVSIWSLVELVKSEQVLHERSF